MLCTSDTPGILPCRLRYNGSSSQRLYSETTEQRAVVGSANHGSISLDSEDEDNDQQHTESPDGMALAVEQDHHSNGIRTTPQVAPTFDGQSSWFEFEDLIMIGWELQHCH